MVLFVSHDTSRKIGDVMWDVAREFPNRSLVIMSDRSMHGEEPPLSVNGAKTKADVIFGVTKFSLFHTNAKREAVKNGARFANMADYSLDMFGTGDLFVDFIEQGKSCDRLSDVLEDKVAHVTTKAGTDIKFSVVGLNNNATLRNRMLEAEGVMGTMHFGFGSNISFGGTNWN